MDDIRSVRCPRCGVGAGEPCNMDGTEQEVLLPTANLVGSFRVDVPHGAVHLERIGAYLEANPKVLKEKTHELLSVMKKVTGGT